MSRYFFDVPRVSANEAEKEFGSFPSGNFVTADYAAVVRRREG